MSGRTPSRCSDAGEELVPVRGVPGGRRGHEVDPFGRNAGGPDRPRRTDRWRRRCAAGRPGGTDRWRPRPGRAGRSPSGGRARARPAVGRPVRRSAAGSSSCRSRWRRPVALTGRVRQARRAPERSDHRQGLVAQRVDPGTGGQSVSDQRVQALDPVRHAARADAGDLGHLAEPARSAGRPGGRRHSGRPAPGPPRAGGSSAASLRSPPAASRPPPRSGRSGSRSWGTGCRPAAGAGWRRRPASRTGSGTPPRRRRAGGRPSCAVTACSSVSVIGSSTAHCAVLLVGLSLQAPGGIRWRVSGEADGSERRRRRRLAR